MAKEEAAPFMVPESRTPAAVSVDDGACFRHRRHRRRHHHLVSALVAAAVCLAGFIAARQAGGLLRRVSLPSWLFPGCHSGRHDASRYPYGRFPQPDDPFQLLPCTNRTLPPALDDADPAASWARLYEPDPSRWSWGNVTAAADDGRGEEHKRVAQEDDDPYANRGIYLCGYLDVPLDWTNASDPRTVRLAVTKFQVSGLARVDGAGRRSADDDDTRHHNSTTADDTSPPVKPPPGQRSRRTIVVEPGGPGGSGTSYVWRAAETITHRLSKGALDVLGWDPRGVNATQPAAACFPHDADRDRWWQLANRFRAVVEEGATLAQLAVADAQNEAVFAACWQRHGDLGRFVGTGLVARDLDALRDALGEPELTGYMVSYGTGIGQTYANLFPDRVGRVILDGTEYVVDEWKLGGFGWTALDNGTHAWRDGVLGECAAAGPRHCALAAGDGGDGPLPTAAELEARLEKLLASIAARPIPAYTRAAGPSLVTYSALTGLLYGALYRPPTWPAVARMLADLERGNATLAADMLDAFVWQYNPARPPQPVWTPESACPAIPFVPAGTDELTPLVICADAYDDPEPKGEGGGLRFWDGLWANMTAQSWIAGDARFYDVLPCRHFARHWPQPAGVYRGPLNRTLAHPVLLVAETYDPATPLRNGRRLAADMGHGNARLVVHHGYGHGSSADPSACTNSVVRRYITTGAIPDAAETDCYADEKPYRYGFKKEDDDDAAAAAAAANVATTTSYEEHLAVWREHMQEMRLWNPGLVRQRL